MLAKELGIDLGSINTALVARGQGIIAREPSVVAIDRLNNKLLAVGSQARTMIGKAPDSILPIQPVRGGVICDLDQTTALLRYMIRRVASSRWLRPRLMLTAQTAMTPVEQRALLDAALQAGASEVALVDATVAAALGADLPVLEPKGSLVVNLGGGTTDVAVISLGAIVIADSIPVAGDQLDEAILRHLRREHSLIIGEPTAERVKVALGSAIEPKPGSMQVTGRHLATGLPTVTTLQASEVYAALQEPLARIDELLLGLLERTPPELMADISRSGITLTGGTAQLSGMAERLSRLTGLAVALAEAPADAVALGTARALRYRKQLRLVSAKK